MTTRILVVDLLSSRLPAHWVAGAVVVNAHRMTDTSGEGFAVRLLRAGSSATFVRGLSDQPTSFGGFSKVGLADDGMALSCIIQHCLVVCEVENFSNAERGSNSSCWFNLSREPLRYFAGL